MDGWTVDFVFMFAFSDRAYAIGSPVPPPMELLYTGCPRRNVPDFGRVFLIFIFL
jgi:hypothetical protein